MTLVLTIATSELRRLAGIDATDTSQDTILAAVATAEQPALEWALDPTTLTDTTSGVRVVLVLGVSEQLAGSYLQQVARAPAPLGALAFGPIKIMTPPSAELRQLGLDLVSVGTARLAPYTRAGKIAAANVAALAAAKLTIEQAAATNAADLDAAKLTVAQAAAAKVAPVDPSTVSLLHGSTGGSLFGTLNPLALDTDDADPFFEGVEAEE